MWEQERAAPQNRRRKGKEQPCIGLGDSMTGMNISGSGMALFQCEHGIGEISLRTDD
jgi:hypothetical protein